MSSTTDAAATLSAATLSAAAELAPDPNEVTAADKDAEMYASAPCTHPPSRWSALLTPSPLVCVQCGAACAAGQ